MSASEQLKNRLDQLREDVLRQVAEAADRNLLYQVKVKALGKQSSLSELMKDLSAVPKEDKPLFGKLVNEAKQKIEQEISRREIELQALEWDKKMESETLDLTLPSPVTAQGSIHPVSQVSHEIASILSRLGYSFRTGPWIESDSYNFESLNVPKDHPAREMQDTFFLDEQMVLRTHTSPIQIHCLESEKPPLRIVGLGAVFRCDSDLSHLPHFHQIEGMCVDENVSMADLKGTIGFFVREFFGKDLKTRFRPSYFPFTEPSAEVDCTCPICRGQGCAMCKQSGWIEIGGCGLIHPKVLSGAGVETPRWSGFAFGFGIERMAIIRHGITDIRLFPESDLRFLRQF